MSRLLPAILAAACLAAGACNILGPAAYIIDGPPKTPAVYTLPDRPVVVFVDDRQNILPRFDLRAAIGEEAGSTLLARKVVTQVISGRDALGLVRRQDTEKDLMPMDAVGKAVGAELVIYVRAVAFTLSPDGVTPRPTAGVEVRVIDAVNRIKLFPDDDTEVGRYVEATLREVNPDRYRSTATRRQLEDALAVETGRAVAKLFFDHETKELGGNLR